MWVSMPSIVIPKVTVAEEESNIDPLYRQILLAYGHSTKRDQNIQTVLPRLVGMDSDLLGRMAVEKLLREAGLKDLPGVMVDCRSSASLGCPAPTYRLAQKTGITKALTFSLGGQAGCEAVQALILLTHMEELSEKVGIITTMQQVVYPDSRTKEEGYPLADGAAAVYVSHQNGEKGCLRVLSASVMHARKTSQDTLDLLLKQATDKADIRMTDLNWIIPHTFSQGFISLAAELLGNTRLFLRQEYAEVDFGCADPLISLRMAYDNNWSIKGKGVILFMGRLESIGAVVVEG